MSASILFLLTHLTNSYQKWKVDQETASTVLGATELTSNVNNNDDLNEFILQKERSDTQMSSVINQQE